MRRSMLQMPAACFITPFAIPLWPLLCDPLPPLMSLPSARRRA